MWFWPTHALWRDWRSENRHSFCPASARYALNMFQGATLPIFLRIHNGPEPSVPGVWASCGWWRCSSFWPVQTLLFRERFSLSPSLDEAFLRSPVTNPPLTLTLAFPLLTPLLIMDRQSTAPNPFCCPSPSARPPSCCLLGAPQHETDPPFSFPPLGRYAW